MLQEINRIKIINKAKALGIGNVKEITMAKNSEIILSLPDDYPEKDYPTGWAKKVIENNLFEFQKDLSLNELRFLNTTLNGDEDVSKINKSILSMVTYRHDSIELNRHSLRGNYKQVIIEMIINGEDNRKILNHARILSENGCVPKEYKNHEFIADQLRTNYICEPVEAIEFMDSYTEAEMEIVLMLSPYSYASYSLSKFDCPEKSLELIKEKFNERSDEIWKTLLAKNWLCSGSHDELVRFFRYYDESKVDSTDEECYVNILCNYKFEDAKLEAPLMRYILSHKKNGFLKKINAWQGRTELSVCRTSPLYNPMLWDILNLNELSEKDINELATTVKFSSQIETLHIFCKKYNRTLSPKEFFYFFENERNFTTWKKEVYTRLGLSSDESLIRVRELPGRNNVSDEDITAIVYALREKRFSAWKKEFEQIRNIKKEDVLEILIKRPYLNGILDEIKTSDDLEFVLKNRNLTGSLAKRKSDYIGMPENKRFLSILGVSEQSVSGFVTSNCFEIAKTYYENSDTEQKDNIIKIAKAAILGKLDILKYADIEKEIGHFISDDTKGQWKKNTTITHGKYTVGEFTDFKSTMIIGEMPVKTCQSYKDGSYNECLLSNFDANKKIVYVSKDGELLGRAILRLTKASDTDRNSRLSFMDVTTESETANDDVELCLFLEKPYVKNGVSGADIATIKEALKTLAKQKACEMNLSLYCNEHYSGEEKEKYIYISRSKNGQQYLDSLIGNCGIRNENWFHKAMVCV